jgi:uncharacterized membrane protein
MAPAPGVATAVSFIQLLVLAWVLARAAVGFWRALNRKPTPNPLTPFL